MTTTAPTNQVSRTPNPLWRVHLRHVAAVKGCPYCPKIEVTR